MRLRLDRSLLEDYTTEVEGHGGRTWVICQTFAEEGAVMHLGGRVSVEQLRVLAAAFSTAAKFWSDCDPHISLKVAGRCTLMMTEQVWPAAQYTHFLRSLFSPWSMVSSPYRRRVYA
ncbi:hypothetical protein BD309DRAFT_993936 [Dichomitus squalens]|uniref:Uncharacterized protein n=1 Tax=Dichomitus squalens TaxID=114155 RepID=A0A4Q9PXE8_9APHY|nr:hypothetical protein BD311DRAFT_775785 [Dichomitus squalens]TBU39185.1 hypothetical protein BD309DRAFT_993936 [Dichomitus squalens]TBU59176.1 hypothetical protein BD310DRAFT_948119 [Dichomitus squalens]